MRKICSSLLLMAGLTACASNNSPTPNKIAQDILNLPPNTFLTVKAQANLAAPKDAQSIVKLATFQADDNLYDQQGNHLIIPRGALIVGLYANDGVNCSIEWKSVYANQRELDAGRGTLALAKVTAKSNCDVKRGIKLGERITLNFVPNLDDF